MRHFARRNMPIATLLARAGPWDPWVAAFAQDWPTRTVRIVVPFGRRIDAGRRGATGRRGLGAEIPGQRICRGKQARRQRQSRYGHCRQSRPRRLNHRGQHRRASRHQYSAVFASCLTIRARTSRPSRNWSPSRAYSRSIPPSASTPWRSWSRCSKRKSGQIQLCFDRQWLAVAPRHGSDRPQGRRPDWCTCPIPVRPGDTAVIRNDVQMPACRRSR